MFSNFAAGEFEVLLYPKQHGADTQKGMEVRNMGRSALIWPVGTLKGFA
jgi:hypothetical protein